MVKTEKRVRKLQRDIVDAFLHHGVRRGLLDPTGKTDAEFAKEARAFLLRLRKLPTFSFVTDYSPTLLKHARQLREGGEHEVACILFATWLEHWANGLIESLLGRAGYSPAMVTQVVRDSPFRAKVDWLPVVLGAPPLAEGHVKKMVALMDVRNSYVHYKWHGYDAQVGDPQRERTKEQVEQIEKTIRYLQQYESRNILRSQKRRVTRLPLSPRARDTG